MVKPNLIFGLLLLFSATLGAQNDTLAPRTLLRKMELGLDAVPYIAGEVGVSVLFKTRFRGPYFRGNKHRQTVLRSHFKFTNYDSGFGYSLFNLNTPDTTFYRNFNGPYHHLGLSLGIEQQFVRKRLGTYIGAEAFAFTKWVNGVYQTTVDPVGPDPSFVQERYDGSFREKAFGFAGLVGIRYFLHRRLSVGLEAHFSGALSFSEQQNNQGGVIVYDNSRLLDFRLQPIRVLYLSYHFGR